MDNSDIKKISEIEFKTLLEYLGEDLLKNELIILAKDLPKNSKYYNGSKGSPGSFWNGFRKENISFIKVKNFYNDELYSKKSNLKLDGFLDKIIKIKLKQEEINEDVISKIVDYEIIAILKKLYNLPINDISLEKISEEKLKKKIEGEFKGEIEKLKKEITSINKENEKKLKEFEKTKEKDKKNNDSAKKALEERIKEIEKESEKKITDLKGKNEELENFFKAEKEKNILIMNKLNGIYESITIKDDINSVVVENRIDSKEKLKDFIINELYNMISDLNSEKNIDDRIVNIYILYKIMES